MEITYMKLLLFIFALSNTLLQADLVLSKSLIEHQAKLADKSFSHTIGIHNSGTQPIKIDKIENSCTCTSVKLSKKTLLPGQKATLSFTIQYKKNRGLLKNTISLFSAGKAHKLTIKNYIPEEIDIHPRFLFWKKESFSQERQITIKIHPDFQAQLLLPKNDKNFSIEHNALDEKTFQLKVKLHGQHKKQRHKVKLQFKDQNQKVLTRDVYFFIQ